MAYLVVRTKTKDTHQLALKGPVVIGRSLKCDLWLDDPSLSREHCRFESDGRQWYVVDLRSRNGTYVGTQPIDRFPLTEGLEVRVGGATVTYHEGTPRPTDPSQAQINRLLEQTAMNEEPTEISTPPASMPSPKPMPRAAVPRPGSTEQDPMHDTSPLPSPRPMPVVRPAAPTPSPKPKPPQP